MANITKEDILAYLDEATILDLNDLVKAIEEKYGVTAAVAAAAPAQVEEVVDEAPKNVTVVLSAIGDTKVAVIKAVKAITGLGLVDAKKLVDSVPAEIKKDVPADEADNIRKQLVEAGATVEYK